MAATWGSEYSFSPDSSMDTWISFDSSSAGVQTPKAYSPLPSRESLEDLDDESESTEESPSQQWMTFETIAPPVHFQSLAELPSHEKSVIVTSVAAGLAGSDLVFCWSLVVVLVFVLGFDLVVLEVVVGLASAF